MRKLKLAATLAAAGLSLFLWALAGSAGLPSSELIGGVFRTLDEADSLRAVLRDSEARRLLQSTAGRMALFNIGTLESADEESWYHLFEFESPQRRSSKMYRIVFVSRKQADGSYDVDLGRARFESDESPENSSTPVAVGGFQFHALLELFTRESTFQAFRAIVADDSERLQSFRLSQTGSGESGATLRFTGKSREFDDATATVVVMYDIEYDAGTEDFAFTRVE